MGLCFIVFFIPEVIRSAADDTVRASFG